MKKAKSVVPLTKSIPITKGLESTAEEIQLKEDEARADYRDLCMYVRIINGMIGRKGPSSVKTLNNIVRTRHLPVQDFASSSYQHDDFDKYTISSVETTTDAAVAKDGIQVIMTEPAGEEEESPEEETIFVLDL
jgi:hypothetical protein